MKDKKIASTPKRAPATHTTDDTQIAQTEQAIIFNRMLEKGEMDSDLAYELYGIKHLHSIIPELELKLPIERRLIIKPHPKTNNLREIKQYWIEASVISEFKSSKESREKLGKQQKSTSIAKARERNNRTLEKMCRYCLKPTMESKLDEIYGKQAANDD